MLNWIWLTLVLSSILVGVFTGNMEAVSTASVKLAKTAVTLSIGMIGVMAFWLGLMKVAQDAGLLSTLARAVRPLMKWLFPDVPGDHPAMSSMIMNIASNMLGLGNAATPFGIKAMTELETLNKKPGTATNAMALFLAINTSNVTILPLGVMGLLAAAGSAHPGSIFITTILATTFSTIAAIAAAKFLQRLPTYKVEAASENLVVETEKGAEVKMEGAPELEYKTKIPKWLRVGVFGLFMGGMLVGMFMHIRSAEVSLGKAMLDMFQNWLLVLLIGGILIYGFMKEVKVYESLVDGARKGFQVAIKIIPYLVAILVAIGMFRASGALDFFIGIVTPITTFIGMPPETLPMAMLRSLSGSGAYGLVAETINTHGPDSLIGQIVATMQGSTETTFYVLAVYCGVVAVKNLRHAMWACLIADAVGILSAVYLCKLFY